MAIDAHPATPEAIEALGRTFARAFDDDPIWRFLCGDDVHDFATRAAPFFAAETRRHLAKDAARGAITAPDDVAGALWSAPGAWRTGIADTLRIARPALRLMGFRIAQSLRVLAETERVHPREPHWYLALLGTDPDHQGHGYGSAVMAPVLAHCDAEGIPAYLESSKEANVPFYERHGFTVTDTIDLAKGTGPRMWLMWRTPQPPTA